MSTSERARLDPDELAALEEQRAFLLQSLDDLDREYEFGDLDEADYTTLRTDYTVRAAHVLRDIEDHRTAFADAAPERPGWRRFIVAAAVVCVAVVGGVVVTSTSGSEDHTGSGEGTTSTASKATQACIDKMRSTFMADDDDAGSDFGNDAVGTIRCFTERIADHPDDAIAYTYRGRTLGLLAQQLQGVASKADVARFEQRSTADLAKARELAPDYPDALAFSAMAAVNSDDIAAARRYLADLDALQLPGSSPVLPIVNNVLRPAVAAAAAGSTTTTSVPAK